MSEFGAGVDPRQGREAEGIMATQYLSFEEVLKELQVGAEELKRLVSDGDLPGFRDGNSMKFKKEHVLKVKKGRETEPTIILTDSDQAMGTEETSDELILDDQASDEPVLNIDDIVDDVVEGTGISLADEDEDEVVPTVEVPALEDEDEEEVGPIELEEEEEEAGEVAPKSTSASRIQRSARLRAMQIQEQGSHIAWTLCLVVTSIFLILPVAIYTNLARGVAPVWMQDVTGFFKSVGEGIWGIF